MNMRVNGAGGMPEGAIPECRWGGDLGEDRLDFEALLALRLTLAPEFHRAGSWAGLSRRLAAHGLALRADADGLHIVRAQGGVAICHTDLIGYPPRLLAQRLGPLAEPGAEG